MNTVGALFCAGFAALGAVTASAEQICNDKSTNTNVREGPSAKSYPAIDSLVNGTPVKVIDHMTNAEGYEYLKIEFSSSRSGKTATGYVYGLAIADTCTDSANPKKAEDKPVLSAIAGVLSAIGEAKREEKLEEELKKKDEEIQRLRAAAEAAAAQQQAQAVTATPPRSTGCEHVYVGQEFKRDSGLFGTSEHWKVQGFNPNTQEVTAVRTYDGSTTTTYCSYIAR